jgi:hypothetical protein
MKQFNQRITAAAGAILIALTLAGLNADQALARGKARKGAKVRAGSDAKGRMSTLQNSENVRSQAERRKAAGTEAFSIDIGTSESIRPQIEKAGRMKTYENVSDADIAPAIRARSRKRARQ